MDFLNSGEFNYGSKGNKKNDGPIGGWHAELARMTGAIAGGNDAQPILTRRGNSRAIGPRSLGGRLLHEGGCKPVQWEAADHSDAGESSLFCGGYPDGHFTCEVSKMGRRLPQVFLAARGFDGAGVGR